MSFGAIMILFVGIIFALALIPAVMAYGQLTQSVDILKEQSADKIETIISLEARIIVLEKIAAGTEVSLEAIKEDVKEIKLDIRDIANAVK